MKEKVKDSISKRLLNELREFFGPQVDDVLEIVYADELSEDKYIGGCPTGVIII